MTKLDKKREVLLIQGGWGSERDIGLLTAKALSKALEELKRPYTIIQAEEDLPLKLAQMKNLHTKVALIGLHGKYGEDGTLQALCEYLRLPYTGSGVLSSALCMDKVMTRKLLTSHGLSVPPGYAIDLKTQTFPKAPELNFPLVVKPSREGSSFGVSLVKNKEEWTLSLKKAAKYDHLILVEKYIEGIEYTLPFLSPRVLPSVEIVPQEGFYNYENKYTSSQTRYCVPARVPKNLELQSCECVLKISQICRLRGYARVDFRLDLKQNIPYVIEVNTLPGLTPNSLFPKSAAHAGISFLDLVGKILESAELDHGREGEEKG